MNEDGVRIWYYCGIGLALDAFITYLTLFSM